MVSTNRLLGLAVVGVVILVALVGFTVLLFPLEFVSEHYSSYTTSIGTNATVENATVWLSSVELDGARLNS